MTLAQIAKERGVSVSTVHSQLDRARRRFPDLHSSAQLLMLTYSSGWLELPIDESFQDEKATAAQHGYLRAFRRFLSEGSKANRQEMNHMLRGMWYEAEILPPPQRPRSGQLHG